MKIYAILICPKCKNRYQTSLTPETPILTICPICGAGDRRLISISKKPLPNKNKTFA